MEDLYMKKIEDMTDEIVASMDQNWPIIYKIRYIYLEVGKRLYRDTDFFFSVDGKLAEQNLTVSEIKDIYNNNLGRDLKVICKSASYILKLTYDKANIRAKMVETNTTIAALSDEEEFLINHWMLAVYDDEEDKTYFATLTPDLPYIQMNMETRHFGSNIPYKRDFNGNLFQVYKGDEINHSVISRERLKEIDTAIGYLKSYYRYNDRNQEDKEWFMQYDNAALYMLRDHLRDNKLYYSMEITETDFYKDLTEFYGENNRLISFVSGEDFKLTKEDWNCWIKIMCRHVQEKIENILGYSIVVIPMLEHKDWNYDSWLLNLCSQLQDMVTRKLTIKEGVTESKPKVDFYNFKYNKWFKSLKKCYDFDISEKKLVNILEMLNKMNTIVNYLKAEQNNRKLSSLFENLATHFIPNDLIYENNIDEEGCLSNYYIANKFNKVFPRVFSCNEEIMPFNKMGYSEQTVIIKELLNIMFPEVTFSNSCQIENYDDNYNAVSNRIQIYQLKSKKDGEYSVLFNIIGGNQKGDYYFFYDLKKNTFEVADILDIYNNYIIVSSRMKNRVSVEDIEKIDDPVSIEETKNVSY